MDEQRDDESNTAMAKSSPAQPWETALNSHSGTPAIPLNFGTKIAVSAGGSTSIAAFYEFIADQRSIIVLTHWPMSKTGARLLS